MKIFLRATLLLMVIGIATILLYCKKDESNKIPADKIPILETLPVYGLTNSSVICSAAIGTDNGYTIKSRGFCWSTNDTPTINDSVSITGAGAGTFTDTIINLNASTRYYIRAYATNDAGTGYGSTMSFVTEAASLGTVLTGIAENITASTATCYAIVIASGGTDILEKGICYSTTESPDIHTNKIVSTGIGWGYTVDLSGLIANNQYYYRAYMLNSVGVSYGDVVSFKTRFHYDETMTDVEGNVYPTIKIGDKVWMAENLRTTHYNDSSSIELVTDNSVWNSTTTGAYCWYNNEAASLVGQGVLYNAYAVNSGKLCPPGWHIPTEEEFQLMYDGLWVSFNYNAFAVTAALLATGTNTTGFSAIYAGIRSYLNDFEGIDTSEYGVDTQACFWSSTSNSNYQSSFEIKYDSYQYYSICKVSHRYLNEGLSVRCVKN